MSTDRLHKGDLVLVTGASGLLGSTLADELLQRGFKVRGVTRNASQEQLLQKKFDEQYGTGNFELVEIADASKPGAYVDALKGVTGIIHAATDASFSPDYDTVVSGTVGMSTGILEAALAFPEIKSVVLTSSRVAIYNPEYGKDETISLADWNEGAVQAAQSFASDHPLKGFLVYAASKTKAEQAVWAFVKEKKPTFAVNTVLPETITGPVVNPAPRVYSTATWITELFKGKTDGPIAAIFNPPGFLVDVRDTAVIHIGALLASDVSDQRLWASAYRFTGNEMLAIWRKAFPNLQILPDFDLPAPPKLTIDNSNSTELLKRYAGRDYITMEQTLIETVQHLA